MKSTSIKLLFLAGLLSVCASCGAAVAALLIRELLNDEAPKRTWTGTVRDSEGNGIGGVLVQVRAEVSGDDDTISYSDETDFNGEYRIGYRWNEKVDYSIRVVFEDQVLTEQQIGKVELGDQSTDFVVTPPSS
ncbi:MAG: carboxypeptidase-like regulatory domain-containing protein [bacterium]